MNKLITQQFLGGLMKSIFSIVVLILLSQNVVFAEGNYEDTRRISQSNVNYRDLLYVY